jgi:hypothetical protein
MLFKEEERRRKALVKAWQEKEWTEAEARVPLARHDLERLFRWVDDYDATTWKFEGL